MAKRKSHDQFVKEVFELVGDEYVVVSKYLNARTKITLKHNNCGHEWDINPNSFLKGNRCPQHQYERITTFDYKEKVYRLYKNEYIVVGDYVKENQEIEMEHVKCGNNFMMKPSVFLYNRATCPHCNITNPENIINSFKIKLNEKYGGSYVMVSDYVGSLAISKFKHMSCNNEFESSPNRIMNLKTIPCPDCSNKKKMSKFHEMFSKFNSSYKIINEPFMYNE